MLKPITILRQIRARPRLSISIAAAFLVTLLLPQHLGLHQATRLLIGWNVATCLYLVLGGIMMTHSSHDQMRHRALLHDEGQRVILTMVVIAAIASLVAIIAVLAVAKSMTGMPKYAHIALALLTILSSWAFTHMMFALHYAHDYYVAAAKNQPAGLAFPEQNAPDYLDFLYFACVIGTSGQTADVAFTSTAMRRTGLVHCVLAFIFNTTVLALTINIAASLF